MTVKLPEWIEMWGCDMGDGDHDQLIEALTIAIQALEAVQFRSLEATFRQCTMTDQEIAEDALARIAALGGKNG